MKLPVRIVAPVVLAVGCTALLIAFLWYQLSRSTIILQNASSGDANIAPATTTLTIIEDPADAKDQGLFHLRQGDLLALRGQWAAAQREYEQAVQYSGGLIALRKLAQAQLQLRDMSGVRSTIRELKRAGARPEDLLLLESIVALRTGELVEARQLLDNAEDSPQKHYGLALLAIVQGNHQVVQDELAAVIKGWEPVLRSHARTLQAAYQEFSLFPNGQNTHLVTLLARALANVQECEIALPLLVQVTQAQSDYRDAWIVQGYCELTTDRAPQALASLEQAYNLDPQKPEVQYFLARAYAETDSHRNAITFLEFALENGFEPQAEIYRLIAEEALKEGDAQLAFDQYKKMVTLPDATVEAYEGLVTVLVSLGKSAEAYEAGQQAVQRFPDSADAYEILGWAAIEAGKEEEARSALEHALELSPFLQSAKEKLQNLDRGADVR